MEKVTAVASVASLICVHVVVDNTMPTAKTNNILINWCLYPIKISSSVKNILSNRFSTYFFHSHPFSDMFIINGKSTKLLYVKFG